MSRLLSGISPVTLAAVVPDRDAAWYPTEPADSENSK